MSLYAGILIDFGGEMVDVEKAISVLIQAGWRPSTSDDEYIGFLPLSDDGDFNWEWMEPQRWDEVIDIIRKKTQRNEVVGIILIYEDTSANFLFNSNYQSVNIIINTINRRIISTCENFTDYSWYITRIVCPLSTNIASIQSVKYEDFS